MATSGFQFGVKADAGDAPAVGLEARPLVQRGAVHGRVVRQLGGFHQAGPRLLLGDVAGLDGRMLAGLAAEVGGGQDREAVARWPLRVVFLDEPRADQVIHRAARGVGVAVKVVVGQVGVGHGAIQRHVRHGLAFAVGDRAARGVAIAVLRARRVFPPMAGGAGLRVGPLAAGRLLPGPAVTWRAGSSRDLARQVLVPCRRLGRRGRRRVLSPEQIGTVTHGDPRPADP